MGMRTGNKPMWLQKDNRFYGVSLGSDYCAEHEWGIKGLRETFPDNSAETIGLEGRRIAEFNPDDWFLKKSSDEDSAILLFGRYWYRKNRDEMTFKEHLGYLTHSLTPSLAEHNEDKIAAAWDEKEFGLLVKGKNNIKKLEQILEAAQTLDLACWLGGGGVFQNAGLILGIISKTPNEHKQEMKKADQENNKFKALVKKVEEETQITEKVKQYGLKFFALSPRRKARGEKTKYPITYWLNPSEYKSYGQGNMKFGIVTIEELLDFINGNDAAIVTAPTASRYLGGRHA